MKKVIAIMLLALLVLFGSRTAALADRGMNTGDIKVYFQSVNGFYATFTVVDSATGVQYVAVAATKYSDGMAANAIAICPRYNADGTLYTGN